MSDYSALFSAASFQRTIQKYCHEQGWAIRDINDNKAILKFEAESGTTQTVYIIRYDTTLEFSVPSKFFFADDDAVPHRLSTDLLRKNSEKKVGFWCIETINDESVFSLMHNEEVHLIDSAHFSGIVRHLVRECDEFEIAVDNMD